MNFVALRIIPEAHLGFAVVAVYCRQFVRITFTSVHAVLSQNVLITGVFVEEQSKPKYHSKSTGLDIFNKKCLGKVCHKDTVTISLSYLLFKWRWVRKKLASLEEFFIISPEKIGHTFPHPNIVKSFDSCIVPIILE